ncbi:hypothetical protein HDU87_007600 [Geranomyces variabilis]|uniref:Uncharacterized protein n=1 Tax=Geranomyces variabilis TaxID=109894 RepID=A0AAD5TEA8_9FUNG|nr:hypothetical protein HDU87_007600 [Geranomyces variabilis]
MTRTLLFILPILVLALFSTPTTLGLSHDANSNKNVKNNDGGVRLLPIDTISAHEQRLRNAPLASDAAAVERAWNAAVFDAKRKLTTEYKMVMGMLENARWIDPKKLDKNVNALMTALPASTASNGIAALKSAISALQRDFIAAVASQNISYTPTPAVPIMTFISATMYATMTAPSAVPAPATINVQEPQDTAAPSPSGAADAGASQDSAAVRATTVKVSVVGVMLAVGCAVLAL